MWFSLFFILSQVSTNTQSCQNWRVSRWLFLCYRAPSEEVGALPPPHTQTTYCFQSKRGGGGGLTRDYLGKSGRNSILKLLICVLINLCCTLKLKGSLLENKNHEIVQRIFILNSPDERNRISLTFYKKIAQKRRILKTYFNIFLKRLLKNKNITSHQFH